MASAVLEIQMFVLYCLSFLRASEPKLFQHLHEYFWFISHCGSVITDYGMWTIEVPHILVKLQGKLAKSGFSQPSLIVDHWSLIMGRGLWKTHISWSNYKETLANQDSQRAKLVSAVAWILLVTFPTQIWLWISDCWLWAVDYGIPIYLGQITRKP